MEMFEFVNLIKASPEIDDNEIEVLIKDFIVNQYNDFYLLINPQDNYYTIFQMVSKYGEYSSLSSAILNCLKSYGHIKYINVEKTSVTIITDVLEEDGDINIFHFMPFDEGVVTVNK